MGVGHSARKSWLLTAWFPRERELDRVGGWARWGDICVELDGGGNRFGDMCVRLCKFRFSREKKHRFKNNTNGHYLQIKKNEL